MHHVPLMRGGGDGYSVEIVPAWDGWSQSLLTGTILPNTLIANDKKVGSGCVEFPWKDDLFHDEIIERRR